MKKSLLMLFGLLLLLSSCGTYEASGAYTGASFGSIIGSAIGGITGGWRGHEVGKLAGLAGGAVVGAAVGKAADNKVRRQYADDSGYQSRRDRYREEPSSTSGADDRIQIEGLAGPSAAELHAVKILDARFMDVSRDGQLTRGEEARVVLEITNTSTHPVYQVLPMVQEVTGNRHIHISQNVMVESIQPHQTIRYTAMVKADNGLRNGEAVIRVGVMQGGRDVDDQEREFVVRTLRR